VPPEAPDEDDEKRCDNRETGSLAVAADAIHAVERRENWLNTVQTVAVLRADDGEGECVLLSGANESKRLTPRQRATSLALGITPYAGSGHAERVVLSAAYGRGWEPVAIAAHWNFCGPDKADCVGYLWSTGAVLTGPKTAYWP
jgi:hypothetical protein